MAQKRKIKEAEAYKNARAIELEQNYPQAIAAYRQIIRKNPLHIDAIHRLLILYRKTKQKPKEVDLLKKSIAAQEYHIEAAQKEWLLDHKELADRSRPLAKMLGLLNAKDLPFTEHEIIHRWKKRLERLIK